MDTKDVERQTGTCISRAFKRFLQSFFLGSVIVNNFKYRELSQIPQNVC